MRPKRTTTLTRAERYRRRQMRRSCIVFGLILASALCAGCPVLALILAAAAGLALYSFGGWVL